MVEYTVHHSNTRCSMTLQYVVHDTVHNMAQYTPSGQCSVGPKVAGSVLGP